MAIAQEFNDEFDVLDGVGVSEGVGDRFLTLNVNIVIFYCHYFLLEGIQ